MINPIAHKLLNWYKKVKRPLPWRENPEPYKVWLSEIILQQTRVNQGMDYYHAFLNQYPSIHDLAKAEEDAVLKLWQGLGYYSRARNLLKTAKRVSNEFQGHFPERAQDLKKLPGIGPYTAAAIASICFEEEVAVLDGNVYRFLSRLFDIDLEIGSTKTRRVFEAYANQLIQSTPPGEFNQAMMEFGSLQCIPQNPNCGSCVVQEHCLAFERKTLSDRPVKAAKKPKRQRFFRFFLIGFEDEILLDKRGEAGIWRNLYQFPLLELKEEKDFQSEIQVPSYISSKSVSRMEIHKNTLNHLLSHQSLHAQLVSLDLNVKPDEIPATSFWVKRESFATFAVPKLVENLWNELNPTD